MKQTTEERRERNRLRSERWRRAHGIGPRKPAQRPWLAEGISRSTWYRRRAKARREAALAFETSRRQELLSRAESFTRQLQAELAEAARCQAIATAHIPKCHHHGTTQEPKRKTALARSSRVEGRSVSRAIWKLGSVFNIAGLCQNLLRTLA